MRLVNIEERIIKIDDEDYDYITECYNLKKSGKYILCTQKSKFKRMGLFSGQLQKVLMNPYKTGRFVNVDHKDGDEDNYQKDNLRVCTHGENMRNRKMQGGSSEYKGVHWNVQRGAWQVYICLDKKISHYGYFEDEIAAANCYNYQAMIKHGEFANLNDCPYMSRDDWLKNKYQKVKSSKYRGVSFVEGLWLAQIYHLSKNVRIGSFENELDACIAYNEKAIELKGDKAKLNIIHND